MEPWERQDGESTPAFEAFALYRDMGPGRSIRKVADRLDKQTSLIFRWSAAHRWVLRVTAWEREDDRLFLAEQRAERKNVARRAAKIAGAMQSQIVQAMQSLDTSKMSPDTLAKWLDVTAKVQFQALGVGLDGVEKFDADGTKAKEKAAAMSAEERAERLEALARELDQRRQVAADEAAAADQARREMYPDGEVA